MNPAHLHLLLNHVPVLGAFAGVVLLAVSLLARRDRLVVPTLLLLLGIALISFPTYLSGEPAEELIEHTPAFSEPSVERHEEAALVSLIAVETLGAIALIGLVVSRRRRGVPRGLGVVTLVVALVTATSMAWTAYLGGQISHPEIRPGWTAPAEAEERPEH